MEIRQAAAAKAGMRPDESEDRAAFAIRGRDTFLAVVDGATEAAFSREWAAALSEEWLSGRHASFGLPVIRAAAAVWNEMVPAAAELPWYGQQQREDGSRATGAFARLRRMPWGVGWAAWFVGDCELFVLRRGRARWLARAEPLHDPDEFGYQPHLISTRADERHLPHIVPRRGRVRTPAEIWMATDAFAQGLLRAQRTGERVWDAWASWIPVEGEFSAAVDAVRAEGLMRNDDVAVLQVCLP